MAVLLASDEIKPLVEKLVEAYPNNLANIDVERIIFLKNTNGKKKGAGIKAVPSPYDLVVNHKFILTVYAAKWNKMDDNRKAVALFDELVRIKDFDEGKLKGYSIVGNKETLETWGIDWDDETTGIELTVFTDK